MGESPGLNWYAHYKEYWLYGGSLYRGTTVIDILKKFPHIYYYNNFVQENKK